MGPRAQTGEKTAEINQRLKHGDNPGVQPAQKGRHARGQREKEVIPALIDELILTKRHFFKSFFSRLDDINDPRQPGKIEYPLPAIIWAGIDIFLFGSGSRQHFDRICDTDTEDALNNFNALSGTAVNEIPLARTVANTLECINSGQISRIAPGMINTLIRNRVLERYRLLGKYYMVAIDATGWMSFDKPHCEHCLRKTHKSGKVTYYHMVLEAKLVTTTGMALSIATEFVENMDPDATKQDCELKAMSRLLEKLRNEFPNLPICLLLDGLYANQTTFKLCKKHQLEYIITFKRGSLPSLYKEFKNLGQEMDPIRMKHANESQELSWVNDLSHEGHTTHGFSCRIEEKGREQCYFAWLTSFSVNRYNIDTLANEGGRLRWKIENEGFNVQKNCEYQMEHVYSHQPIAGKNYYLLMQVAHLLLQLLLHGRICKAMQQRIRELRNFFRLIKEHFTNRVLPICFTNPEFIPTIQIRLDSS